MSTKLIINKKSMYFMFLLLPYLEPLGFKKQYLGISIIDNIYTIAKVIVFICILLYIFYKRKFSKMFIFQASCAATLLFSTLFNGNGFEGFMMYAGPTLSPLSIVLIFDIFRDKIRICINALSSLFAMYCLINFWTFIEQYYFVYQGSMLDGEGIYFFSIDNRFIFYFIPSIACTLISAYITKRRTAVWILLFLMVHAEFILLSLWSVSAMVVMTLIILWICILYKFAYGWIFNIKNYMFFVIICNISMYVVSLYRPLNITFRTIAEKLFHKGSNLNDRFVMWQNAVGYLIKSPLLGEGIKPIEYNYLRFKVVHAHNLFMDITFKGGFLSLIFFFGVLYFALKPLYNYRETVLSKQISFLILMSFILSLVDTYNDALFYILLCLSYNLEAFLDISDVKQPLVSL